MEICQVWIYQQQLHESWCWGHWPLTHMGVLWFFNGYSGHSDKMVALSIKIKTYFYINLFQRKCWHWKTRKFFMQSRSNLPVRSSSTNHGPQTVVHAEDTLKKKPKRNSPKKWVGIFEEEKNRKILTIILLYCIYALILIILILKSYPGKNL